MKRVCLTDGTGRWVNIAEATKYEEGRYFDGRNMISKATNSQWEHETLYRTGTGRWVLHRTSAWQGVPDKWIELSPARATAWLVRNEHEPPAELSEHVAALEIR